MTSPTSTRKPTSHIAPFGVRMQPELKSRLEELARQAGRSLNAEIVTRLERTLEQDDKPVITTNYNAILEEGIRQSSDARPKLFTSFSHDEIEEFAEKLAEELAVKLGIRAARAKKL